MQHINLETFANGAFTAQVNRAIEEVTKNIQDPNTDAGTARKITVTIAFKPNQERNFIASLFGRKRRRYMALMEYRPVNMWRIKSAQAYLSRQCP